MARIVKSGSDLELGGIRIKYSVSFLHSVGFIKRKALSSMHYIVPFFFIQSHYLQMVFYNLLHITVIWILLLLILYECITPFTRFVLVRLVFANDVIEWLFLSSENLVDFDLVARNVLRSPYHLSF
ncbi:hypothetical protein BD560DRAFT_428447 [Blakeslea trispora]|nr:hypothetical protein BD560DRAFT_428447 [Blakeslea trispora]